jgi:hypothetical protein
MTSSVHRQSEIIDDEFERDKRPFASYLRAYLELRPFPVEQIETWMPILAAARLSERIAQEEDQLLCLVETVFETSSKFDR